jgi:putative lipoprotein
MSRALRTAVLLAGLGCASAPSVPRPSGTVSGTVVYRERMAIPPDTQVTVLLWDALGSLPASKLGQTTFRTSGQVPIPFEVTYDPAAIVPDHTYAVRASITVDGKLWFESAMPVVVITQGAPSTGVQVLVQRVTPPP